LEFNGSFRRFTSLYFGSASSSPLFAAETGQASGMCEGEGGLKRNLYHHTMAMDIPAEDIVILMHMHLGLLLIDGMLGAVCGRGCLIHSLSN